MSNFKQLLVLQYNLEACEPYGIKLYSIIITHKVVTS